jgi:chromosome segregation ATPase
MSNLNSVSQSKDKLLNELVITLDNYSKTVSSPNLVNSLLENNNDYSTLVDDTTNSEFYKNESLLIDVVKGLEVQINKLQLQNDELKSKQHEHHEEELSKLKRKLKDEKTYREEVEQNFQYIKQVNRDLEAKIHTLEEDNKALKNTYKETVFVVIT